MQAMANNIVITGSSGLVGSECVRFFASKGWNVHGIDNNSRMSFFGPDGDTRDVLRELVKNTRGFTHHDFDIRGREQVLALYAKVKPEVTIHCAAQPSHDLARSRTFEDFEINATATLGLLDAAHRHAPQGTFIFMSTNKVYGDAPNELPLVELETRWDYAEPEHHHGIDESCRLDASTHSFFGVSKAAADLLVQEYGRCYGMNTACFRGGCLTGAQHAGAELHGFLAYLVRAAKEGRPYTVFGYKGKQVRDNLHTRDVCGAFWSFVQKPRVAAVYNLGGGRENSVSMREAITKVESLLGRELKVTFSEEARMGDHICYISDLRKFRSDYPDWRIKYSLDRIFEDLVHQDKNSALIG